VHGGHDVEQRDQTVVHSRLAAEYCRRQLRILPSLGKQYGDTVTLHAMRVNSCCCLPRQTRALLPNAPRCDNLPWQGTLRRQWRRPLQANNDGLLALLSLRLPAGYAIACQWQATAGLIR